MAYFLESILEKMTSNVVISEVHALMYAVTSEAEKHVPYGELLVPLSV